MTSFHVLIIKKKYVTYIITEFTFVYITLSLHLNLVFILVNESSKSKFISIKDSGSWKQFYRICIRKIYHLKIYRSSIISNCIITCYTKL